MTNPGERLLRWWKTASPQARWVAGIVLFSLVCTAVLLLVSEGGSSAAGTASSETAQAFSGAADPSPWFYVDAFLKLLVVIGLFVGAAVVARHYSGKKFFRDPSRQLEVLETVRLSPRQAMHLVRVGQRSLLIGATDQSFTTLADLGSSPVETFTEAAPAAAPDGRMASAGQGTERVELQAAFRSVLETAARGAESVDDPSLLRRYA